MWKDKLQEIVKEKEMYGEKVNTGASKEEIDMFAKEVMREFSIDLPNDHGMILEVVNGLEFNGFILYGIDQSLLDSQPNQRINGLIEYNKIWHENEWHKDYIFIGESNISWYVYDYSGCRYIELDNPSGREIEVFNNLDSMVEKIMGDALA